MAELIRYCVINGGQAQDYPYQATVNTQSDIEEHRENLYVTLNKSKSEYSIYFGIRKEQGSRLSP